MPWQKGKQQKIKVWTVAEEKRLKQLVKDGYNVNQIAILLKRSHASVKAKKGKLGLKRNNFDPGEANRIETDDEVLSELKKDFRALSYRELEIKYAMHRSTIKQIAERESWGSKPYVFEEREDRYIPFEVLFELYFVKCLSVKEIERELKTNYRRVNRSLKKCGIEKATKAERRKRRTEYDSSHIIRYRANIKEMRESINGD